MKEDSPITGQIPSSVQLEEICKTLHKDLGQDALKVTITGEYAFSTRCNIRMNYK